VSSSRHRIHTVLLVLVVAGWGWFGPAFGPGRAAAAVVHVSGFEATVDGFTSWYGSYGMGAIGTVWCIDHGIPAPDAAYGYVPTDLTDHTPDTRRALAWALGRYGGGADRITSAALTLDMHDLSGARYPSGPLNVNTLGVNRLSGFAGAEAAVLARAREVKADAVAHSHLVPPLQLKSRWDGPSAVVASVIDAQGAPVAGVAVHVAASGATLNVAPDAVTGGDGSVRFAFAVPAGPAHFVFTAVAPDLVLQAFAPTHIVAQRAARPATVRLAAAVDRRAPTTTTSTSSSTTTTTPAAPAPPPAPPPSGPPRRSS